MNFFSLWVRFSGLIHILDQWQYYHMVLCIRYKILCNPMHVCYSSLPVPYVPVWVTRGAVVACWSHIGVLMVLVAGGLY